MTNERITGGNSSPVLLYINCLMIFQLKWDSGLTTVVRSPTNSSRVNNITSQHQNHSTWISRLVWFLQYCSFNPYRSIFIITLRIRPTWIFQSLVNSDAVQQAVITFELVTNSTRRCILLSIQQYVVSKLSKS